MMRTNIQTQKGSALVMALAIVVTFSTIAIALSELVMQQAMEVEYLLARSRTEYIAFSGLVHTESLITEDQTKIIRDPLTFTFQKEYCVAWISVDGLLACDSNADPVNPCCEYQGNICARGNTKGVCTQKNLWEATYDSRYDSNTKSIISSGAVRFRNLSLDPGVIYSGDEIEFFKTKQMDLAWE